MKVSEVIAELQKLDQERNIWVEYDGMCLSLPIPDQELDKESARYFNSKEDGLGAKKGDYIIIAG